ncbi:MAG: hypothetical protein R3253_13320 [Longimicrobiales bacterium]|nr:hypothetical protein [Longimicrobiales bacterium]
MQRATFLLTGLALLAVVPPSLGAQSADADRAALIRNALSAAPPSVAEHATVALPTGETLRAGSNGYVCMPDDPNVPNNSPMCLDEPWLELIDAWMNQREPQVTSMGVSYMLQGDMPVSNVDPFATEATPDNAWIQSGPPHIMVVIPDAAALEGLPTDPHNGGPWVMWKGTPYAHIMIPTVPRGR